MRFSVSKIFRYEISRRWEIPIRDYGIVGYQACKTFYNKQIKPLWFTSRCKGQESDGCCAWLNLKILLVHALFLIDQTNEPGILVIFFCRKTCNWPPGRKSCNQPPKPERKSIVSSTYQNFQVNLVPVNSLYTLIFAFYCNLRRKIREKHFPKQLSGRNFQPNIFDFLVYISFLRKKKSENR